MNNEEKKKMSSSHVADSDLFALTLNKTTSPQKKKHTPLTIEKILQTLGKPSLEKFSSESINHFSLR